MKRFFILVLLILFTQNLFARNDLDKVKLAIKNKNANWEAAENPISRLSKEEFRKLLGSPTDYIPLNGEEKYIELPKVESLPASFDWRNNNGNWLTSVKNQASCGSCWDFSAVGQIEAWWKIYYDMPDSNINLSEQYILSCGSEAGSCEGGWADQALEFVKNNSIPHESFMTYQANDNITCSSIDSGWEATSVTIPGWGFITLEEAQVINIKNALLHHPVSANYDVYEDFSYYNGGVYEHTFGEYEGGHAILIVGWEDENQCWICKNSWGSYWGSNGFFRIKWGNCGIGEFVPFIYDEIVDDVQIAFSEETISKTIQAGAISSHTISVANNGTQTIDLYTSDSQDPITFHKSSNNAYSGRSWWCGTKEIGGYSDYWLQYLETPNIDLTSASNPELNFMAKWSIELPGGTDAPYDGWDGWNVWISNDNGENYTIIDPVSPEYTNNALWSFGHPEQGWNMGTSVKGWTGYSAHWIPVKFDLSTYTGQNVKIRFAFASDKGYSSVDDESLEGLFIDNISVIDNETVIYKDNADYESQMEPSGFGDLANDWLDIYYDNNRLAPSESMDVQLNFTAPKTAGKYSGDIKFMANNDNKDLPTIPVELVVGQPNSDLAIDGFINPSNLVNINLDNPIELSISNLGSTIQSNIVVSLKDNAGLLDKLLTIENILPGQSTIIGFDAVSLMGQYDATLIATISIDDDILDNNIDSTEIIISDMIDNFEKFNSSWEFDENCSYSIFNSFGGSYSIKFQNTAIATFQKPIKIGPKDFYFKFYATTTNSAASLKLESSYDKINWTEFDSVKIIDQSYTRFEIMKNFDQSQSAVWFRLVVENPIATSVVLDNLALITIEQTDIEEEVSKPHVFQLNQNYPNPFNPTTVIEYQIPKQSNVSLKIFDVSGKLVETLVHENQRTGSHKVNWDAANHPSGIYFYKLMTNDHSKTQKMILMK